MSRQCVTIISSELGGNAGVETASERPGEPPGRHFEPAALTGGNPGELTGHRLIATGATPRTAAGHRAPNHQAYLYPPVPVVRL